jgi:DNA polymerase-1
LASSAALVQAFRRASSHDARLRANADLLARFARTTLRECRVAALLGVMEHAGIGFDVSYARRLVAHLRKEVESIEREADALAVTNADGSRLNLAAPAQVAEALFVTLRLQKPPAVKAGRNDGLTHNSTRDEVLRALACDKNAHPLVGLVLRHRAASRAAATCASYVSMYEKENGARDCDSSFGRLRCEWNNTRTATGRLSSSNPNLQAVGGGVESHREAARDEKSEEAFLSLRGAFVAPSGRVLLAADYSQIELRVLAHLARDPKLLEILAPPPRTRRRARVFRAFQRRV